MSTRLRGKCTECGGPYTETLSLLGKSILVHDTVRDIADAPGDWVSNGWGFVPADDHLPMPDDEDTLNADGTMDTTCEECGESLTLTTVDGDGVLIGDECECGEYVTRYMPGQAPR